MYPRGTLRYLVDLSIKTWRQYHVLLTPASIELLADTFPKQPRRHGSSRDEAVEVFNLLNAAYPSTAQELPIIRPLARAWLERRQMAVAMQGAVALNDAGRVSDARQFLEQGRLVDKLDDRSVTLEASSDDFLKAVKAKKKGAVPTGFRDLDALWEGGYRRGELGLIAAPTGVGKSMMLCFMAATAFWKNKRVLYYTFELTEDQIRERITLAILEKGRKDIHNDWATELADKAKSEGVAIPKGHVDVRMKTMTWPDLEADLEEYKAKHGKYPDVLLLDSADDLAPISKREKTYEALRDAYTRLRAIAHEKRIRVWTSAQLNREAIEKAKASLKNIGDSFAKAQRSHYVLAFTQTTAESKHKSDDPRKSQAGGAPRMSMWVLKDSLHGTTHTWFELEAEFGHGLNGYPGFTVVKQHGGGNGSLTFDEEEED